LRGHNSISDEDVVMFLVVTAAGIAPIIDVPMRANVNRIPIDAAVRYLLFFLLIKFISSPSMNTKDKRLV